MADQVDTKKTPWTNRIVGHEEVSVDSILENPANWRIHGKVQQMALSGLLNEVGLVQSVIVNKRSGRLIDGHLRLALAKREGQPTLPVVIVDLNEEEERKVLATLDPIGALAERDNEKLSDLLEGLDANDDGLKELLQVLSADSAGAALPPDNNLGNNPGEGGGKEPEFHTCPKCGFKYAK